MSDFSADLRAMGEVITLGGKAYQMDFDNLALAYAEQIYREQYGRPVNAAAIIDELFEAGLSAVMAVSYGAMRSGGAVIDWKEFSKNLFTYENYPVMFSAVTRAVTAMFTPASEAAASGADEKNGDTHGGK